MPVLSASELSIPVLITDHHLPGETVPAAAAIINPNLRDCDFPSKSLAGVGVAFYLMLALRAFLRDKNWFASQGSRNLIWLNFSIWSHWEPLPM